MNHFEQRVAAFCHVCPCVFQANTDAESRSSRVGALGPLLVCLSLLVCVGCRQEKAEQATVNYKVRQTWQVDELPMQSVTQFEQVFWEPDDTISLRQMIVDDALVVGRDVLEIGTGTGLLAILCQQNGADRVVATDINPAAIANAKYNAEMLSANSGLELRLVSKSDPSAFSVLKPEETFDVILSNPPWEEGGIREDLDHAFYDPYFKLMDSFLDGFEKRLRPGGRFFLVYGNVPAIRRLQRQAEQRSVAWEIHDERSLDELPENFLPGMLIELKPRKVSPTP